MSEYITISLVGIVFLGAISPFICMFFVFVVPEIKAWFKG